MERDAIMLKLTTVKSAEPEAAWKRQRMKILEVKHAKTGKSRKAKIQVSRRKPKP